MVEVRPHSGHFTYSSAPMGEALRRLSLRRDVQFQLLYDFRQSREIHRDRSPFPILTGDAFKQQSIVPWAANSLSGAYVFQTAGSSSGGEVTDLVSFRPTATAPSRGLGNDRRQQCRNRDAAISPSMATTHLMPAATGGERSPSRSLLRLLHDFDGQRGDPGNHFRDRRSRFPGPAAWQGHLPWRPCKPATRSTCPARMPRVKKKI